MLEGSGLVSCRTFLIKFYKGYSVAYTHSGRIFSAYLRPWVLDENDACAHVPHLRDLDIKVSDVLAAQDAQCSTGEEPRRKRRLQKKQNPMGTGYATNHYVDKDKEGNPLTRNWWEAWNDYRCYHVVSEWASRIIQQFNASHLADSLEAAEDDFKGKCTLLQTSLALDARSSYFD